MILSEATLQAILNLQQQGLIVGDPDINFEQEGDFTAVTLKVQMPLQWFHSNKYLDRVYRTLEDTGTKICIIVVDISAYEPLDWEEA